MDDAELERAAEALRRGRLVGMPTETVYGLAADAGNPQAVLAVFAAKGRPTFDPLIVHLPDASWLERVALPSPRARRLAAACWPGPLTLVLPRTAAVPDVVTAGLDTVAVRVPDHDLARALIRRAGCPLAAPSANRFGYISPTTAAHVRDQLGGAVALVLDGGPCAIGVESTVLRPDPLPVILRPGGCTRERLEEVLGEPVAVAGRDDRAAAIALPSPGLLASHYAPRTPLALKALDVPWPEAPGTARLAFRHLPPGTAGEALSPRGDLAEAAAQLFAALRRLDAGGFATIIAEEVPAHGLGLAINDRLRRAAGRG